MAGFFHGKIQIKTYADIIAVLFIIIFCLSGISTLSQYGMTWDEGLGNFFFGERYLRYVSSFNENYLNFNEYLSMHKEHPLDLYKSRMRGSPEEFPALADVASAATMYVFSYKLEWLDPVDGFHLFTVLLVSLFLLVFYFFISRRLGSLTALFSLLFLGSFPRLWGDMHFNVKDVPEMVFFGFALMAYWRWFEKPSWKGALLVGLASGAALGVKANALFLPIIFVLGVWRFNGKAVWQHLKSQYLRYGLMLVSALLTFFLSWPYLYANPLNVQNYFAYIFSQGGRTGASTGWNWQPLSMSMAVIPEIMLVCLLIGLVYALAMMAKKKDGLHRFALVWMLVPIVRISMPPSVNFDGIRHFLEFVPGAALLAGIGAASVINYIGKLNVKRTSAAVAGLCLLMAVNAGLAVKTFGPYQYLYFNRLFGGLPGAKAIFGAEEATDYWASSYRQGIQWLNENAEKDSALFVSVAPHVVNLVESIWLRDDIIFADKSQYDAFISVGKPVYVMFITRPPFYDNVALTCLSELEPVYSIEIENEPILVIYQK